MSTRHPLAFHLPSLAMRLSCLHPQPAKSFGRFSIATLLVTTLLAASVPSQAGNLLVNGDFSQGATGWHGFFNEVDHPTPADDLYVGKPFVNTFLDGGGVRFKGFYDVASGPNYHYRLAPPRPHLTQTLELTAGAYALSWTDQVSTHGMQGTMAFEVLLDGVQVVAQRFWTDAGATPSGAKSLVLDVAASGSHILSFGLSLPGFRTDHVYLQWMDQIVVDNLSLTAAPVPEAGTWSMMACGLFGLGWAGRRRSARVDLARRVHP